MRTRRPTSHYVEVTSGEVNFDCLDPKRSCHLYPSCSCEHIGDDHEDLGPEHVSVLQPDCWMEEWFRDPIANYVGSDRDDSTDTGVPEDMNREGYISAVYCDEVLEWSFFEPGVTS